MKKIFLDCGAHDGCSIRLFKDSRKDYNDFEIYCFEPNPNLAKYHPVDKATFFNKAVWIENGKIKFFNYGTEGGSTLLAKKAKHNNRKVRDRPHIFAKSKTIKVECIDLSSWIKNNFSPDDYIVLKLDVEGAEYAICLKMFRDDTFKYINEFYCEFNSRRCRIPRTKDDYIIRNAKKLGIKCGTWDAMTLKYLKEKNCAEYKIQSNE